MITNTFVGKKKSPRITFETHIKVLIARALKLSNAENVDMALVQE